EKRLDRLKNLDLNKKVIIGTIAAVDVKFKGQEHVIKAISLLKKQGIKNIEYQLVGGGDETYLRKIAERYNVEEQIKFMGSLPHQEVFKWLDSIDIYIQPSKQEGLPRALIEAMSRGLPAFGTNTGGIPELLDRECIISKRHIEREICRKIKLLNRDFMIKQAMRNFEEAKKYKKEILEERRKKFFEEFLNEVEYNKNYL
ncbi:MAG: glycosyltransferase, partial [Fervidobacterium sp.]